MRASKIRVMSNRLRTLSPIQMTTLLTTHNNIYARLKQLFLRRPHSCFPHIACISLKKRLVNNPAKNHKNLVDPHLFFFILTKKKKIIKKKFYWECQEGQNYFSIDFHSLRPQENLTGTRVKSCSSTFCSYLQH